MNKVLICGDVHGQYQNIKEKVDFACRTKIDRIIILGDWGLWWNYGGVKFIDDINEYARSKNRQIFAICGNHENMDWWNSVIELAPRAHGSQWHYLRTNVLLSARTQTFVWGGRRFAVAGGAVSIDAEWRRGIERGYDIYALCKVAPQRMWSPDEALTDEEVNGLIAEVGSKKVDYLLTHDCSDRTPFKNRIKPDIDSQINRQRIDKVLSNITPRMQFHGHMHERYDWMNLTRDAKTNEGVYIQTYGLEADSDKDAWGVLDLDADTFTFGSEILATLN